MCPAWEKVVTIQLRVNSRIETRVQFFSENNGFRTIGYKKFQHKDQSRGAAKQDSRGTMFRKFPS
jgi:hypothetical protein